MMLIMMVLLKKKNNASISNKTSLGRKFENAKKPDDFRNIRQLHLKRSVKYYIMKPVWSFGIYEN